MAVEKEVTEVSPGWGGGRELGAEMCPDPASRGGWSREHVKEDTPH